MNTFRNQIQARFTEMMQTGKLYRVALTGNELWEIYINSFSDEHNPVFRDPASSSHNCNHCNNFIRRYGNIVAIDAQGQLISMFDVIPEDVEYRNTANELSKAIINSKVCDVFFETYDNLCSLPYESTKKTQDVFQLGVTKNVHRYTKDEAEQWGVVKADEIRTFHHLSLELNKSFVDFTGHSIEKIQSEYRDANSVFQRAMNEISLDTLNLVKDLINQESLLDGKTHLFKVEAMILLKKEYDDLPVYQRDNWCWIKSYKFPLAKFKNELIGVLCSDLSQGEDLNEACKKWNMRVDPKNFMKTKAPITKNQIELAEKFVEENGYTDSFDRRHATIEDIKASEILHLNSGSAKKKSVSVFEGVKATATRHKKSEFDGIEEMTIDKFMTDILPGCSAIELYLTNNHEGNLVSLTTAKIKESKPIMKWSNNYSWTFNGNLAGKSQIKEAVKNAGGKIDGVLRFSITWNEDGKDILDFDAHCIEPNGNHIYYNSKQGKLDVDMRSPRGLGVENIVHKHLSEMKQGVYKYSIVNYDGGSNKSFKAEIEFSGEIYTYHYQKPVAYGERVNIAEVTLKDGVFSINHLIPESSVSSKILYGLETNQLHKVNLVCLSPNHWNDESIGNKHYFFMLENCKAPGAIRAFHSENLLPELAEHRKVLEVVGATKMIESTDKQLSGVGFNATVRDEVILKLHGSHRRMIKVKF